MKGRVNWLLFAILAMAVTGCVPAMQSNRAELNDRVKKLHTIVMLSPDTKICELNAGGVKEQRDDWCAAGQKNLEKAIMENLNRKAVNVKILKVTADLNNEVDDVKTLYRTVMASAYTHAYNWDGSNPDFFPERWKNFDYSVGSLEKLLKKQKADGLLLVHAQDEISSTGRKALRVVQALNPFATADRSGTTAVNIALADHKGDILWNTLFWQSGGYDLRELDSTRDFVKVLLENFPQEGK